MAYLEEGGQKGEELLVELLELAATNGLEEGAQEGEVVGWLGGMGGVAHRLGDDRREVRAEEWLILGEEGDGAEYELEEAEKDGRLRLLGRAQREKVWEDVGRCGKVWEGVRRWEVW